MGVAGQADGELAAEGVVRNDKDRIVARVRDHLIATAGAHIDALAQAGERGLSIASAAKVVLLREEGMERRVMCEREL